MQTIRDHLEILLIGAAIGQLLLAFINLRLEKLLKWQSVLNDQPALMREVFYVHKWFITIILLIFGILTLRFAGELSAGTNELGRWLAAGIAAFWLIRTGIQWFYYDWSHWRGHSGRTAIHWFITVAYGGCCLVYLLAAFT